MVLLKKIAVTQEVGSEKIIAAVLHVHFFPQHNLEHKLTCLRKKYNIVQSFLSVGSFFCSVLYEQDGYWMYGILHIVVLGEVLKIDLLGKLTNDAYWMESKQVWFPTDLL